MRRELEATRSRMSRDMDVIERRLRQVADDMRGRLDLLQPARERIREDVWRSLGLAFGAGVAFAFITAKGRDGRRSFVGEVLRSALMQMPAAVISGVRAGIGDALQREWREGSRPRIGAQAANA